MEKMTHRKFRMAIKGDPCIRYDGYGDAPGGQDGRAALGTLYVDALEVAPVLAAMPVRKSPNPNATVESVAKGLGVPPGVVATVMVMQGMPIQQRATPGLAQTYFSSKSKK